MREIDATRKLLELSKEKGFGLHGGLLRLHPERPFVVKTKGWKGKTVNYILLLKVLLHAILLNESAVASEYPYTVKAKLIDENGEKRILLTFFDENGYATLGVNQFRMVPLLEAATAMKSTIPFYQLSFKTTDEKPFKLVWKLGKILFTYKGNLIELPVGDRYLLKASLSEFLVSKEVKPFLGFTCGTRNDEETGKSYLFFGVKELREEIEITKENFFDLLTILY